jgi:hypothetical protein
MRLLQKRNKSHAQGEPHYSIAINGLTGSEGYSAFQEGTGGDMMVKQ